MARSNISFNFKLRLDIKDLEKIILYIIWALLVYAMSGSEGDVSNKTQIVENGKTVTLETRAHFKK